MSEIAQINGTCARYTQECCGSGCCPTDTGCCDNGVCVAIPICYPLCTTGYDKIICSCVPLNNGCGINETSCGSGCCPETFYCAGCDEFTGAPTCISVV